MGKNKNKARTALVTGGAGFIGSNLCKYLLKKGHRVICIDNLLSGSLDNISDTDSKDFVFLNNDVTEPIDIKQDIDIIFHLASPASPVDYANHPVYTLKVGALGTINMLEIAKNKNAVMLLASTSEIYGDPQVHPQSEDYYGNVNPVGPRSIYNEAKRFAESITYAYYKNEGVDTKIARIFNTFGPNMRIDDGRVIPNFIGACLKNQNIAIYGDGKQTRSFCFVDDMVEGLYRLINSDFHQPVNLGNTREITILELAMQIRDLLKADNEIVFMDLPGDDPKLRRPDITRAKNHLNWYPEVKLEDGLIITIESFKENFRRFK